MAQQQLTAQQRASLFAQMTRQHFQMLAPKKVVGEQETIQIELPKNRLLSKIIVEVDAMVNIVTGTAGASVEKKVFSPYEIIRRISLDLNNGFMPFVTSGKEIALYNMGHLNAETVLSGSNPRGVNYVGNTGDTSTAGGKDNRIKFQFELPVVLNDRDPVGLVALQNQETNVTLTLDVDKMQNAYVLKTGESVSFKSMNITAMTETFTIPPAKEAFPDISVLKLVSSKRESFTANASNVVKLSTGTIYRKMFLYFEDSNGQALTDADFNGQIELVFNQADTPYSVKPSVLSAKNAKQLGFTLPDGVFLLDFSNQGIPNLGGSRDYIDTERLTEFWLRFTPTKDGQAVVVSENLTRLREQ